MSKGENGNENGQEIWNFWTGSAGNGSGGGGIGG
jgi:hypothetical protein